MNGSKIGSGDKVLDWMIIIGAVMLFAKTADVLSFYAPSILNDLLGFDVSGIFGFLSAVLVEGTALALHFNRQATNYTPAIIVKWIVLSISGACQVFDGYITTGQAAQMSEALKATLTYGVPNIPLIVIALIFAIGKLPEGANEKPPFIGLKNLPTHFKWIWEGEKRVGKALPAPTGAPAKGVQQSGLFDESVGKNANPTNGKVT